MKKGSLLLTGILVLVLSLSMRAQTQSTPDADFFTGKWSIVVKGTPNGDAEMIFNLENLESKITGVITDTTGVEISKISGSDLTGTALTLYFNAAGYDISLLLNKKDEDHLTGSMLGMFEAEGIRIKEDQ